MGVEGSMSEPEGPPPTELDDVLLDPASVFSSPEAVLHHAALTVAQKAEILRRWEYDAAEIAVAVEEGMPDADDGDLLRRILLALGRLRGGRLAERSGPTKQHGLSGSTAR